MSRFSRYVKKVNDDGSRLSFGGPLNESEVGQFEGVKGVNNDHREHILNVEPTPAERNLQTITNSEAYQNSTDPNKEKEKVAAHIANSNSNNPSVNSDNLKKEFEINMMSQNLSKYRIKPQPSMLERVDSTVAPSETSNGVKSANVHTEPACKEGIGPRFQQLEKKSSNITMKPGQNGPGG